MGYKVLGQSAPTATTNTDVYTVPASTEAVVSTIMVANRGAAAISFRMAVRPNGAAIADQHYIYYDVQVPPNASFAATLGVAMDAADVVTAYVDTATVSVSLFGREVAV